MGPIRLELQRKMNLSKGCSKIGQLAFLTSRAVLEQPNIPPPAKQCKCLARNTSSRATKTIALRAKEVKWTFSMLAS
jgi:hypothetical protein